MNRYINIDKVLKELHLNHKDVIYIDKNDTAKRIEKIPSIDLADYVPKDFHDKTCEAMAKRHQEEIADILERADVDRPQGEWVDAEIPLESGDTMPIQVCNLCKTFYPLAYTGGGHRFCPNCGARMKGANDE